MFFIIIVIINYSLNFRNKIIFDLKTKRKVKSSSSLRILFFLTREILLYRQEVKTGWNVGQQVSFFLNEITNDTEQDVSRGNRPFDKEKKETCAICCEEKTVFLFLKPFLRNLHVHLNNVYVICYKSDQFLFKRLTRHVISMIPIYLNLISTFSNFFSWKEECGILNDKDIYTRFR